ncbi:MAG: hypothetical protein ACFFAH_08150 [Promethearchaeota archaeon]
MASLNVNKRTNLQNSNLNINKASFIIKSEDFSSLQCDKCASVDIIETIEGYVCRTCGIVLPYQKLEYHRPYNSEVVQHAALGITQVGTPMERLHHSNSDRLLRLSKLQSIQDNEKSVIDKAKIEISRIFNCLGIPESRKESVITKFKEIRSKIKSGTKYRTPDKLIPLIIYFDCKLNGIALKEQDLLEVSKIEKKAFNAFKLKITEFLPEYKHRDRKECILQRLYGLVATYERGMPFYYSCKKFLYKFWPIIKNTKDDVIVGLAASVVALIDKNYDKLRFSVNTICTELGIKPSTIHSQVKKKIFEYYDLPKFDTLVKSRTILREFMVRIGLAGYDDHMVQSDIVEIKITGDAGQTFNNYDNDFYYFYIMKDVYGYPVFVSLRPLKDESNYSIINDSKYQNSPIVLEDMPFELLFWWFAQPKGPPID